MNVKISIAQWFEIYLLYTYMYSFKQNKSYTIKKIYKGYAFFEKSTSFSNRGSFLLMGTELVMIVVDKVFTQSYNSNKRNATLELEYGYKDSTID